MCTVRIMAHTTPSLLYVLRVVSSGQLKVGHSNNVHRRRKQHEQRYGSMSVVYTHPVACGQCAERLALWHLDRKPGNEWFEEDRKTEVISAIRDAASRATDWRWLMRAGLEGPYECQRVHLENKVMQVVNRVWRSMSKAEQSSMPFGWVSLLLHAQRQVDIPPRVAWE